METLTLVDGTELAGSILENGDGKTIFVYLTGLSLTEGYAIFSNPENVETIIAVNHGEEHVYEGYTKITAINTEFGNCNITLRRPANAA